MLKYIKIFIVISIFMVNFTNFNCQVFAEEHTFFAQIQNDNVFLFKDKGTSPIFEIPKTFYVKLLEDESDGYYKAQYMNIVGFIRSNEVQCVDEYPAVPYLNYVTFRILAEQSSELRSEPSRSKGLNTLITELPLYETNFIYYGKIQGDEVVPARSDIWYYVSYTKNTVTQYGYVYSGLTDMLSSYTLNSLSAYPINKHNWTIENTNEENVIPSFEPPTTNELIIILAITIPTLLLLLVMFKTGGKSKHKPSSSDIIKMPSPSTITTIPKKKKRGKDYYEIE